MIKPQEQESEYVVALDVGTSNIRTVVAEVLPDRDLNIISVGTHETKGMKRGGITDVEALVESIRQSVNQAEISSQIQINSVYCSISGQHIQCKNERGMISIDDEVHQEDMDEAIHNARNIKLPENSSKLLHSVEQNFNIDNQIGIRKPIGMTGYRLEAFVHLISCNNDALRNLEKCVEKVNNIKVNSFVFGGLAAAESVLSQDEKDIGVCLVDFGGGTIDLALYNDGVLCYSAVFPYAGFNATNDLAIVTSTPLSVAEDIKVKYGSVNLDKYSNKANKNSEKILEIIDVSGSKKNIALWQIPTILQPRYQELLEMINKRIRAVRDELEKQKKSSQLGAGIVFTGGGAKMDGLKELATSIFECPVRIAHPNVKKGLTDYVNKPEYATAIGLLIHGCKDHDRGTIEHEKRKWWSPKSILKKLKEMY